MKALVGAFNQEKALVGAFFVITNLRMDLFEALFTAHLAASWGRGSPQRTPATTCTHWCYTSLCTLASGARSIRMFVITEKAPTRAFS